MKIKQLYTPKDFKRIDRPQMFDLWFRQALTEKQIAELFGVTAEEVKDKRKNQFGMGFMNCGIQWLSGEEVYRATSAKIVEVKPPKDWDGKPLPFPKRNKRGKYTLPGNYSRDDKMSSEELLKQLTEDIDNEAEASSTSSTDGAAVDEYTEALNAVKKEHAERIEAARAEREAARNAVSTDGTNSINSTDSTDSTDEKSTEAVINYTEPLEASGDAVEAFEITFDNGDNNGDVLESTVETTIDVNEVTSDVITDSIEFVDDIEM